MTKRLATAKELRSFAKRMDRMRFARLKQARDGLLPVEELDTNEKKILHSSLTDLKADRGREDFFFFCKHILGYQDLSKMHVELSDFLTRKTKRGKFYRHNLILEPRDTFKTSVVTIGFPLWMAIRDPDCRILISSEEYTKSKTFLREVKQHIIHNDVFRRCYGELDVNKYTDLWQEAAFNIATRKRRGKEPSFSAAGIDVTKVGFHYDIIICDDLVSEKNITTPEQIEKTINYYKLLFSLFDKGSRYRMMIVVGTRWHFQDLYQHIMDEDEERVQQGEKKQYRKLIRPARFKDGRLLFPERLDDRFLKGMKIKQGSYIFSCHPAGSPILMANGLLKDISEVMVGDSVMGFDPDDRNRLVSSTVSEVNSRVATTQLMVLENGMKFRCTPDHQWYTGRNDEAHTRYKPAKVGSRLLEIYDIRRAEVNDEWKYLAALVDGEGSCKYGAVFIHQSEEHNPEVCDRIRECLDTLELDYGKGEDFWYLRGGKQAKLDLINFGKPGKSNQIIGTIRGSTRPVQDRVRVDRIQEEFQKERVYALTTSTGNYVVNGFASKNCQYLNDPVGAEDAAFKEDWIEWYTELPEGMPFTFAIICDPSVGQTKGSDHTAIVSVAVDPLNNWYVLAVDRGHWNPTEIISQLTMARRRIIRDYADKWPAARSVRIAMEVVAFQKVLSHFTKDMMRRKEIERFRIIELKTETSKSKTMRIRGIVPNFENRKIAFKGRGPKMCSPGMQHMVREMLQFPVGSSDDCIDALAYMPQIVQVPEGIKPKAPQETLISRIRQRMRERGKLLDLTEPRVGTRITGGNPWQIV